MITSARARHAGLDFGTTNSVAAVARGVEVKLIVDGLGSDPAYDNDFFAPLRAAGGNVCFFVPRLGRRYLLRNHQKVALADAETADARIVIGGFNIQDDYFEGPGSDGWRDLGLLVEGSAAARLSGYFDALWRWARRPVSGLRRCCRRCERSPACRIVASGSPPCGE